MTTTANEHTMTLREVADLFDVHPDTIRNWRRSRGLPAVAVSRRRVRFSRREVLDWQDKQRPQSPPAPEPEKPAP
jgi:excisionase family DNA binding protein